MMPEPPPGWLDWYQRILRDFSFSPERDEEAAEMLSSFMSDKRCLREELASRLSRARCVVVAGAYDTLGEEARILAENLYKGVAVVSADTATTPLLEAGVTPDIVVTDLDGRFEDIYECWRRGAVIVVHAHGDNIERLRQHLPRLGERVEATCQCSPRGHIHNFGGFTDGDRAVFMAAALGARKIITIGMCLTCRIGRFSAELKASSPHWLRMKRMKLDYAHRLLSWLAETRRDIEFVDATQAEWQLPQGFEKKPLKEVLSTIER
ncbi:hypothetical protein HRbin02_01175 [Candidatus Calditenuaceae archaeon HR02]|nr:hypothetical protein HRbin02_01175 [Candidatus Calditenuaceae archaeon HR02]